MYSLYPRTPSPKRADAKRPLGCVAHCSRRLQGVQHASLWVFQPQGLLWFIPFGSISESSLLQRVEIATSWDLSNPDACTTPFQLQDFWLQRI